jgi:hypothetical protein
MNHSNENPSEQKSSQLADRPTQKIMAIANSFPCLRIKIDDYRPVSFDPDTFWRLMRGASPGERLCALFVLNVWNPSYAARKGWRFEFFEFAVTADSTNRELVIKWLIYPVWP